MRKYSLFFVIIILLIILGGCNKLITTDELIGGKWTPKSGIKMENQAVIHNAHI